ncbi:hypothetical protein [Rhizobium chutanense]|nr:hypothetical protein [Rhizobium chutanense]
MIIELYVSGTDHPPLYDGYIDNDGTIWGMSPPPPQADDELV